MATVRPAPERLSFDETIDLVERLAETAGKIAKGLRDLREPEAAHLVARLSDDAERAAAALRALLEPVPKATNWYQVHRDMWVRYGDLRDLTAMIEHITEGI
jgi:hypothetical protein